MPKSNFKRRARGKERKGKKGRGLTGRQRTIDPCHNSSISPISNSSSVNFFFLLKNNSIPRNLSNKGFISHKEIQIEHFKIPTFVDSSNLLWKGFNQVSTVLEIPPFFCFFELGGEYLNKLFLKASLSNSIRRLIDVALELSIGRAMRMRVSYAAGNKKSKNASKEYDILLPAFSTTRRRINGAFSRWKFGFP